MRDAYRSFFVGVLTLFCTGHELAFGQLPPIGQWREHLSYHHARSISGIDDGFYVATPSSVFSVTGPDNTINRYTTINGLHSIGVKAIQSDSSSGLLVIGYTNSDIDVVSGSSITEVPDLELSAITGDKTIYSIFLQGGNAYLATGLGIVVVNTVQDQVQATYIIGDQGAQAAVYSITSDSLFLYAASNQGLKKASRTASNLADFNNWQTPVGDTLMETLPCQEVVAGLSTLYVLRNDSIFVNSGSTWQPLYTDGWSISHLQISGPSLILSEQVPGGSIGRVLWLNSAGIVTQTLEQPGTLVDPRGVWAAGAGNIWIADAQRGLLNWNGGTYVSLVPNSPDGLLNGQMEDIHSQLWIAGGGDSLGFYKFSDNLWTSYNSLTFPLLQGVSNVVAIAVDPRKDTIYAGSSTQGLIQLAPTGTVQLYTANAMIAASQTAPGTYPVTGLVFDSTDNLWIVNSGAAEPLLEKKPDGSISRVGLPIAIPGNSLGQAIVDDNNYVWIIAAQGYGALCYNPSSNQWRNFVVGTGLGNLPDPNVHCIVMDHQGLIWLGTNNGIAVVECGSSIFSGGCDATLPVVQQDAFAGNLFQGQEVLSIAVDGADRKWVGTTTGAWLISEDGEQVIANFTTLNSPLFNDTVSVTGIDGATGEVFFSTPEGLCSFRGTATDATQSAGNLLVFPNPVPPGYSGTIAIRGVPDNAIVKITEMNGRLVFETKALGGQAVWDGNDYTGKRVASGVYLVLIADENNQQKAATKIVFIH